jgi:hypothetical protein
MSNKHFNQGNVWGRVAATKAGGFGSGTPALSVHVDCSGAYGNIHAFGRIWGKEKIDVFSDFYRRNPDALLKFTGFMSQYFKGLKNYTNFSFYKWDAATGQPPRAAFILSGDVVAKAVKDGAGVLTLKYAKPGSNGYRATAEDFELWVLDGGLYESFSVGQLIEVKGHMQQGAGEDEFGSATGEVRPIVKVVRVIESK